MRDEITDYLAQGKAEGWSAVTVNCYRKRLNYLDAFLGCVRLVEVKEEDLERFSATLKRLKWKRESRRAAVSTVRRFFGWLAGRGKLLSNPARNLAVEYEDEIELPCAPLSVEDVGRLLDGVTVRDAHGLRDKALLEVLYGCGLRLSELLALNLEDIDLNNRVLHVRQGKGGKARDLPLGRGAVHALRDYLALRR